MMRTLKRQNNMTMMADPRTAPYKIVNSEISSHRANSEISKVFVPVQEHPLSVDEQEVPLFEFQ